MNHPVQSEKRVDHLSVSEARHLLREDGIPVQDLARYQNTRFASNLWFWEQLELLDALRLLVVRNGRLYRKSKPVT